MAVNETDIVDNAVAEAGAYDVIRKRLEEQGKQLQQQAQALNEARLTEFGGVEMHTIARTRIRTENNCIARDIVQIGEQVLFAYNVFIGLKKETQIKDVFSLYTLQNEGENYELVEVDIEKSFLYETRFKDDFDELYRYYKEARLVKLAKKGGKLLAGFQVGERANDIKVFRWSISPDGNSFEYIDNRGERDIQAPNQYDFEWIETDRNDFVHGRHPHVNILDTVFVEAIGGDLTVKVEDNTEDGLGIYSEPVEEKDQSLDDGKVSYAKVGGLILIAITPYKEEVTRYLVFNTLTRSVTRIDAIGYSCVQLPEDHGIIFPGGYYLETGETKSFPDDIEGLEFERMIRSPNGEDVLYAFYNEEHGTVGLFSYNLITKSLQNPIFSSGYALYEDGKFIVFSAEEEPTRVHPMQIWQTSYISAEYASQQPESTSYFGKIGNSELVRGVSDLYSIFQMIENTEVSMRHYEELNEATKKIFDSHYWLDDDQQQDIAGTLKLVSDTSELVIDEFEKVQGIQQQSTKALQEAKADQRKLISNISTTSWETAEQFIASIAEVRKQRGHIATIKGYRYINVEELEELDVELVAAEESLGEQTTEFLANDDALISYTDRTTEYANAIDLAQTNAEIRPILTNIEETTEQLDLLSELITTLKIDDTTVRTRIVDTISEVYAKLNQTKARGSQKQKGLGSEEAIAQFSAQFKLFSQSITNALGIADTPEKCDEQLAKLLVQLEDLESQFSDFDQFLTDIMDKREEIYESFEAHKQSLMEARQRRAQTLSDSASRILNSIEKRSLKLTDSDELNTYFASDTLVLKTTEIIEELRELDSAVAADDVLSRFKGLKEQAIRSLRDKSDIYEDGGKVIKLGPKHKFSVNQQELDLTIIPRNDQLYFHLIGTNYYELVSDETLSSSQHYWSMSMESETQTVYRAETLAFMVIESAKKEQDGFTLSDLKRASKEPEELTKLIRDFSTPYYKHGYQKGIHDFDAAKIVTALLPSMESAGLLIFDPSSRALAQLFWSKLELISSEDFDVKSLKTSWPQRAKSALRLRNLFADVNAIELLSNEVQLALNEFIERFQIEGVESDLRSASLYLIEQLSENENEFIQSKYSNDLVAHFERVVDNESLTQFKKSLKELKNQPSQAWSLSQAWLSALLNNKTIDGNEKGESLDHLNRYIPEAGVNLLEGISLKQSSAKLELRVEGLLGEHITIEQQALSFSLDEFLQRMEHHSRVTLVEYQHYLELRSEVMKAERATLKLDSFKAKPLSSFVRNRLVNESYLPLIGDNLAKQMGTVGESKRTDLMGLLMMISPPGYGKTTLMEYVANRLGLIFMKINCPALGHDVTSLDPEQAPNSTARQELEKINLAFEMGNNVMLYLDDIQHTHSEFLQKYISLCDGTRRVEGVWRGETKTYDMRGKKFCVVMAGNPYTESGEVFQVPDMLANRADIYNLGDILGGMEEQFGLSYIENSLTSNPVLAPLATRDMQDVYRLVAMAQGQNVAATELSHQYSAAEINEITSVLQKLFVVQELILKVNQQYIASAAQADRYRIEPPFKLQGSYRNMNKMAEKISSVMNQEELMQLIEDHYLGESQLLTDGTEQNLLKLAELRGNMTPEQETRWEQIKVDFMRTKALGGDDTDSGNKIANQMINLVEGLTELKTSITHSSEQSVLQSSQQSIEQSKLAKSELQKEQQNAEALLGVLNSINDSLGTQTAKSGEQSIEQVKIAQLESEKEEQNAQALLGILNSINDSLGKQSVEQAKIAELGSKKDADQSQALLNSLNSISESFAAQTIPSPVVEIVNQPSEKIIETLDLLTASMETSIQPLLLSMEKKMDIDLRTLERIQELSHRVEKLKVTASKETRTRRTKVESKSGKAKSEGSKVKSENEKSK